MISNLENILLDNENKEAALREMRTRVAGSGRELKYRLGAEIAESSHSFGRLMKLPGSLRKIICAYESEQKGPFPEDRPFDPESEDDVFRRSKELSEETARLEVFDRLSDQDPRVEAGSEALKVGKNRLRTFVFPFRMLSIRKRSRKSKAAAVTLPRIPGKDHCILFICTNGAGLGHLTRCLAIARKIRREDPEKEIIFLTTSLALTTVYKEGFLAYCIPSRMLIDGIGTREWNALLTQMLTSLIQMYGLDAIVFDGATPYASISAALAKNGGITRIWVKRGGEKSGDIAEKRREMEAKFDQIIIPGERNVERLPDTQTHHYVDPIIMLDKEEMWTREEVRRFLKVPEEKTLVYIQLGAGNINETDSDINRVISGLRRFPNVMMVIGESIIGKELKIVEDDIIVIKDYPNSKYFKGFDFAISACGYNSFQELVYFGIPAVFIPNMETKTDDQLGRAMFVEEHHMGRVLTDFDDLPDILAEMTDPEKTEAMRAAAAGLSAANGAAEAAGLILKLSHKD